jgi:prephenate dehydrogenase
MPQRIGIAGVGLLGASMAARFQTCGIFVVGFDLNAASLQYAKEHALIDEAVSDFAELCTSVDALVLAAPVEGILRLLAELTGPLRERAGQLRWIIDVASVKQPIALAGQALSNFVGTHPMAGTEHNGPQAADPNLFEGRPWALMSSSSALAADIREVITLLGGVPMLLDPAEHDAIVAATSHVPQTLSTLLAAMVDPRESKGFYGNGLRSMVRLGASPWSMWRSIYAANTTAIVHELEAYRGHLDLVIDAFKNDDTTVLEHYFSAAQTHVTELI